MGQRKSKISDPRVVKGENSGEPRVPGNREGVSQKGSEIPQDSPLGIMLQY
ncbi:hypothetical protein Nmel_006517 [Mimus melanotis]